MLWKLCHWLILAPVGVSSSSSVGTSSSVASSASVAAVSASAVATAVASALGMVVVPPAWRSGAVAVVGSVAVPVASSVGVSASASAPPSTGGCCGGLAFYFGFKGDFLLAFGGSSFSGAILGAFGARGLGDLFCGGFGSWFGFVLSSSIFAGHRDTEGLH